MGSARGNWDLWEGQQPFRPNPNGAGDRTTTLRRLLIGAVQRRLRDERSQCFFLFPRRPGPVDVGHHPLALKPEYFETAQLFKLLVIFLNFNSFFSEFRTATKGDFATKDRSSKFTKKTIEI